MTPRLDPRSFYHHGIVVTDLDSAVRKFGTETGLTFEEPTSVQQTIRTPQGTRDVEFRLAYSAEGPVHVELVQQIPGTLWVTDQPAVLHHLGYWSEDIASDGESLAAGGMQLVMAHEPGQGGQSLYRYYQSPLGLYVELVDAAFRPAMEDGWAAALSRLSTTAEGMQHA